MIDFEGFSDAEVDALVKELQRGIHAQETMAALEQQKIAQLADFRAMDGVGECRMSLDPEVYWHWRMREKSSDVFFDPAWRRYMRDTAPEALARCKGGTKVQVGPRVFSRAELTRNVRFSRVYGES